MADAGIDKAAGIIMSEEPKFSVAIKNLLSVLVARSQVVTNDSTESASSGPKASSSPAVDSNLLLLQYTKVAQCFLKELSLCGSHDVVEWGSMNPQAPDQGGFDRIDQLTQYKVCFGLRAQVLGKGEKVSKYFGQSLIHWTNSWSLLREAVETKMKEGMNCNIPQERVAVFLDTLAKSMKISTSESSEIAVEGKESGKGGEGADPVATTAIDKTDDELEKVKTSSPSSPSVFDSIIASSNEESDDSELIWAKNTQTFNQVLAERQQKRKDAVKEYEAEMEKYRELTSQLQGVNGTSSSVGSDRVEELPDK